MDDVDTEIDVIILADESNAERGAPFTAAGLRWMNVDVDEDVVGGGLFGFAFG